MNILNCVQFWPSDRTCKLPQAQFRAKSQNVHL
jgi:hypothetical protein